MIRKLQFLLSASIIFFYNTASAQVPLCPPGHPAPCPPGPGVPFCGGTVPTYTVPININNLTYTSPNISRAGNCCGTSSPDRCINFIITLDSNIAAVDFSIVSGSPSPGSLRYTINCDTCSYQVGTPSNPGELGCITCPGVNYLNFCKSGNNANVYRLTGVPKPTKIKDDSIRVGCFDTLIYRGVRDSGIVWTSIPFNATYNSYLNFTSGNDTVIVTPQAGAPAFVDYKVCGYPTASRCLGLLQFCDTVRVYFFPSINTTLADTVKYCAGQGGVNLCAGASGGLAPLTYQWYSPPNTPIGGATSSCYFATTPGLYSVRINDALASPTKCGPKIDSVRVLLDSINIIESHTNDSCFGDCNGTITLVTVGGTPPYTYNWSDIPGPSNPQNRTGLCAGTYTVTVTDNGAGCIGTFSIIITQPANLVVSVDSIHNVGCNGESTGAVYTSVSGGTNPVSYQWSSGQTTQDITVLTAGTYTVTVTDAMGCTVTVSQVITEPGVLVPLITSVTINGNDVSCWLAADDSSCAGVTGGTPPYTYHWTPGDSTGVCITGMGGGVLICVTVTDANGCTGDACHALTQPDSLYLTVDAVSSYFGGYNISCNGFTDGSIDIGTHGGTPPFIYDWSDIPGAAPPGPDEGEDRTGITSGVYTVTVTDLNDCSATISITLSEPVVLYDSLASPLTPGGYNIQCYGECNATMNTSTTGGTAPYTYQWTPNVSSSNSASNLCAGLYTVTITDANGCSFTDTLTVTQPDTVLALITLVIVNNGNSITCNGVCDGSAYVTAVGGSPPYNYVWNYPPASMPTFSADSDTIYNVCAGDLSVIVYDTNGCSASDTSALTEPQPLFVSISAVTFAGGWNEPCFGDCLDTATATPTGGTSPYTYLWSNAQTTQDATGLCAATYTVTVTDVNGCTATSDITLFEPPLLALTLDPFLFACGYNVSCVGVCDGNIDLTVSGGTAPFSYLWSNAEVTEDVGSLCVGTYTVTITDANNCTISQSVTLTSPTAVVIDSITSPTYAGGWNVSCNGGTDGCINSGVSGGCPPYSFTWSNGDLTQNICTLSVNLYILTVTDANGCTAVDSILLTEPPLLVDTLIAIEYDTTNISCNGACDGSITTTVGGGTSPYTYVWSNGCSAATCSSLCAGTYYVTITDANGCFINDSITLDEPPLPLAVFLTNTGIACDTACTNTIAAHPSGGTAPYIYCWSSSGPAVPCPGPDSLNNICIATYTITITDVNGCTATASFTFNSAGTPININLSSTNNSCNAACNDTITATPTTGTPPYNYTWTPAAPNSPNYFGACIGTYTVTVTDVNGCSGTNSITLVSSPVVIAISFAASNYNGSGVSCNGACDGSITANPTSGLAPYTYLWSTSATTQTINSLCAGTYTVTVTDANGCTGINSYTITEPPLLTASLAGSIFAGGWGVSCNGACDDTLTTTVGGGTIPYTYTWSNAGPNAPGQTGICAGTYTVTVTDANGCTASANFTVTEPPVLTISLSGSIYAGGWGVSCNGACDDTLTSSASGGTLPYNYTWSNGGPNSPGQTGICAGTYTVTVTDANGCTASANFTVTEPPLLTISLSGSIYAGGWGVSCNGACDDTLTSSASGGTLPYNYSWSNGAPNSPGQTGICAGTYTVTVTDANGCTASANFTVTEPPVLTVTLSGSIYAGGWGVSCNGACDDTLTSSASGGTLPYTYTWSNGGPNAPGQTGICAGTYTVTVTDANGCTASANFVVTEPPVLAISLIGSIYAGGWGVSCNGACDDTLTSSASGGTLPYNYTWSNGGPNAPGQTGICAGTFTVTVTDANGCTASANFTVTEPPLLTISLSGSIYIGGWGVSCNGACDDTLTSSASGGTLPYNYSWSNGGPNAAGQTGICAGTYTVTVTDANGCTASANFTVTEPPLLTVNISTTGIACDTACTNTMTANAGGGTPPLIYCWSSSGPAVPCPGPASLTNICIATYTVIVTDVNGCTASDTYTFSSAGTPIPVSLSSTNNSCNAACNDTITATVTTGTPPYTYTWTPAAPNLANYYGACIGTYTVTVTDANGCSGTASITLVSSPVIINISFTVSNFNGSGVSCNGACDGSITATPITGLAPYTYLWNNLATTQSISALCAGVYTVTITDANGCTGTGIQIITEPPLLTTTISTLIFAGGWNEPCFGDCLDTLTANPSGGTAPYNYVWSTSVNDTLQSNPNLCAGTYTVTVTDANLCTATASFTVTEPPVLAVALSGSIYAGGWGVSCNGACDDTLTAAPSGGTPPYSYTWSNGGPNNPVLPGICAGTYTVTVTDANNCTASASFIVTEPPLLTISLSGSIYAGGWGVSCNGACDDTLTSTAAGGTLPYNYAWSNGGPNAPGQTGICAGTYTVTVTDANNCTASASFIVTEPPLLTASLTGSIYAGGWGVSCNGACDDTLSAAASGGTSPYVYTWSNGGPNNSNQTGICAGTYTVTVTDANNCTASASFTVTEPPILSVALTDSLLNPPYNNSCPGSCDAWMQATASGGTPPYSYNWSNGDTTSRADSLCGGIYFVTVTDANGCTITQSDTITDPAQPQSMAGQDQDICDSVTVLMANDHDSIYTAYWYVVAGSALFIPDSLSDTVSVTGLSWGTNIIIRYVGDTMCIARDTIIIQSTHPVTADAGVYPDICEGDEPIHLHADPNYTGIGTWTALPIASSPITFDNENDPNTWAHNFGWNSNTIVWTVVDGPCSATDTVRIIKLIPEVCDSSLLEMPTGFSPNKDGHNDNFVIHGIEFSFNRQNNFIVFNRWGNEVYSKENYWNDWYGQNKDGGLLSDGTYFVILTITNPGPNLGRVLKGFVDMRR